MTVYILIAAVVFILVTLYLELNDNVEEYNMPKTIFFCLVWPLTVFIFFVFILVYCIKYLKEQLK